MIIENLEEKLNGSIPIIKKEELRYLIDSWGRSSSSGFYMEIKECYPLDKLNVSQIENMYEMFRFSLFNGDISNWDVSNCYNMESLFSRSKFNGDLSKWNVSNVMNMRFMFYKSEFNNDSLKDWDVSKVKFASSMFDCANFDGDISSWNFDKGLYCEDIFYHNKNFEKKYNNELLLPREQKDFLKWFEENKEKIKEINTSKEEVLDFFSFDNKNIEKEIL